MLREMRVCAVLTLALTVWSCSAPPQSSQSNAVLGRNSRILLARALAEHNSFVHLQMAVEPAETQVVVERFRSLGAKIRYSDATVGYVHVLISPQRLAQMSDLGSGIDAAALFTANQFDVELHGLKEEQTGAAGGSAHLPDFNVRDVSAAYTGAPAMGVDRFIAQHKTFDGRGITIAFLEIVDPRGPGLQKAYDLQGRTIRKIADYGVIDTPFDDEESGASGQLNERSGWVDMRTTVHDTSGYVVYDGQRFRVPYSGAFSIGTYHGAWVGGESMLKSEIPGASTNIAVLWDRRTGRVWFDALGKRVFSGNPAADYSVHGDIVPLPLGVTSSRVGNMSPMNPQTWMAFAIKAFPNIGFLKLLNVTLSSHAPMVADSAAGNGMMGGRLNGIAPGARIVCVDMVEPYTLEALIWAAKHADILSSQFGLTFADASSRAVWDTIVNRISTNYGMIFSWAAGNDGPGLGTLDSSATATNAFAMGGYLSRQNELLDEGVDFQGQAIYSSRGPGPDGIVKPNLLAPTQWLTGASLASARDVIGGKWLLPVGYEIGGGTSQATPTGAGAIALLMSAARQSQVQADVRSLQRALFTTARTVEGLPLDQGYGLIDVPDAWNVLHAQATEPSVTIQEAPLFDRNAAAGVTHTYTIHATANSPVTVRVSWTGTGGAQIEQPSVSLSENASPISVQLPALAPNSVLSGLLELRDARTNILLAARNVTEFAPQQFTLANGYSLSLRGVLPHPGYARFFLLVPVGVSVLTLHLHETVQGAGWTDRTRKTVLGFNPLRILQPDNFDDPIVSSTWAHLPASMNGDWTTAIPHPKAGTWQIVLYGADAISAIGGLAGAGEIPSSPVRLDAAIYGVAMKGCATSGPTSRCTFVNNFAVLRLQRASLPSPQRRTYSIDLTQTQPFQVLNVPVDSSTVQDLRVSLRGDTSGIASDLFYCPGPPKENYPDGPWYRGTCLFRAHAEGSEVLAASLPTGSSGIIDVYNNVLPGRWVVAVYPSGASVAPRSLTVNVDTYDSSAKPVITLPDVASVSSGQTFTVDVPSGASPTIESSNVIAQYRINQKLGGVYIEYDKQQPIVKTLVPVWP